MNRYKQREQALQLIFESLFTAETSLTDTDALMERFEECIGELGDYAKTLFIGVSQKAAELDEEIIRFANGWKLSRIPKINVAILRLAMYEISCVEETPASVAVNEAVELAKKYSGKDDPAFINGVLGSYVRSVSCS